MFGVVKMNATSMHDVKRQTAVARAETVAGIVGAEPKEPWVIWCDSNYEADALKAAIPSAVDVRGSMPVEQKEQIIEAFATGQIKHLIGKPSMLGFGLDWSHCARMVFSGRSYSYETWYQAVRRCWRFGQTRNLQVHIVVAEGETEIGRVVERKADDHAKMKAAMRQAMRDAVSGARSAIVDYNPTHEGRLPKWL
jgi:superfamily II DNA or RNA helicase